MTKNPPTDEEIQAMVRQRKEEARQHQEAGQEEGSSPAISAWPSLSQMAMGPQWVHEFVHAATEYSEADPAAVLFTFLTRFAADAGAKATLQIGDTPHRAIIFTAIVGGTSKARKGTSAAPVKRLSALDMVQAGDGYNLCGLLDSDCDVDGFYPAKSTPGPLSTGEGLVYAVRDESKRWNEQDQCFVVSDPGVKDKRLFVLTEELSSALKSMQREGNTLSQILRSAWDGVSIEPLIKLNRIRASDPHIGIVGHITHEELCRLLDSGEHFSGLSNRFLWVCARRSKFVAFPTGIHDNVLARLQLEYFQAAGQAYVIPKISLADDAIKFWEDVYKDISRDRKGVVGAVCDRAEAYTLRLALVYALLYRARQIERIHIECAMAAWDYAERSAQWIFSTGIEDPIQDKLLGLLSEKGALSLTDIHKALSNNLPKEKISQVIKGLESKKLIWIEEIKTAGRPKQMISLSKKTN